MSHFTVVVAVKATSKDELSAALERAMAPYDENAEVPEYRSYEEGEAADHWFYSSLKRQDEDDRNGTGIKPYKPDELGWSSASSKKTPVEQAAEIAADAALFRTLPFPIDWETLVQVYNDKFHSDSDEEDGDKLFYEAETGRAYTLSTYNPKSKWDYWRVGGRWGGYFKVAEGADPELVIPAEGGSWDSPEIAEGRADGGPKGLLDIAGMRDAAGAEAIARYDRYHELVDELPEARPWSEFVKQVKAETLDIQQARELYHAQPRNQAIKDTEFDQLFSDCPIGEYGCERRVYVERARAAAVPGFALLTADGRWMEKGKMGWFGMSDDTESSRAGYAEIANGYIDELDDDVYLLALDCHI